MKNSFRIGVMFGIPIELHITFLVLPVLFGMIGGIKGVVLILGVFACVTLHEVCHSVVAKHFDVTVDKIMLFPIGGIAMMRSIPETPRKEFLISIVGPLFNISLALVLYYPLRITLGEQILHQFPPDMSTWPNTIAYIFWINPILAFFNLLPAFPLDGGRVFRAHLASYMSYRKATQFAVHVGHLVAIGLFILGFLSVPKNIILIVIAVFIYIAASQENLEVGLRSVLKGFHVKDILANDFQKLLVNDDMKVAIKKIFHSHQEDFPVLDEEGNKVVGLLTRKEVITTLHSFGMKKKIKEVMQVDFPVLYVNNSLYYAHALLKESGFKALPVVKKNGTLMGIVSVEDLMKVYQFSDLEN